MKRQAATAATGASLHDSEQKQLVSAVPCMTIRTARRNGATLPVTAVADQFYAEVQEDGRAPLGHVKPDRAPGAVSSVRPRRRSFRGVCSSNHPRLPQSLVNHDDSGIAPAV
jgi:hypothetical protein